MGFRAQGKTDKEKKLEKDREKVALLEAQIQVRKKRVLSRQFIRDAGLIEMRHEINALESDARECEKLKQSILKREEQTR